MHITAIVLAAGRGLRLKSRLSKPLVEINSQPIIIYSLKTLSQQTDIQDIIVVANSDNQKDIAGKIRRYGIVKIKDVVLGGRERQDSVIKGLKAIDNRTEFVLIHDAVRPFIDGKIVSAVIKEAGISQAAIVGVPVKATIKKVKSQKSKVKNMFVERTLDRKCLWEIQTPQVFKKELILEAYKRFGKLAATDDAMLVERLGVKVRLVLGSYKNIKITTPEDLILAQAIANKLICPTG